jgi:hypothetical protein
MFTNKSFGIRLAAAVALTSFAGCQTLPDTRGVLFGSVNASDQVAGPFIVAAIDRNDGSIRHRVFVEQEGEFKMRLEAGAYKFIAFADTNRDGLLDSSEPVSVRMSLKTPVSQGDILALPALEIRNREYSRQVR